MVKKLAKKENTKPKLWSEDYCKRAFPKAIEGSGGIASVIASRLNTTPQTLYVYQKKFPWILEMRQDAREVQVDIAESKLFKKVREEADWAIKFTLNQLGRHRGYDNNPNIIVNNNTLNMNVELPEEKKREMLDFIEQIDNRKKEND